MLTLTAQQLDAIRRPVAKRTSQRRLRADLAKIVAAFLHAQAPKIAAQVNALRSGARKSDLTPDERADLERILAALDFEGWAVLAGDTEDVLAAIVADSGTQALLQVGIDTEARREVLNVVSDYALEYAGERSAEMVGMRRDPLGRLVTNPDAEWAITEGTRDGVRAAVGDALAEGWSNDKLAQMLAEAYAFSNERATLIARTETQLASQSGALQGYRASGVVQGKQWVTADDDRVSEECEANGNAGPQGDGVLMDLDAEFPSGDVAPPVHPNAVFAGHTFAPYGELQEMVRADYHGPAILIVTAEDHRMTIGPNHPVLTGRGMVKARSLTKGDYLVYDSRLDESAPLAAHPDFDQMPFAEDAFQTLVASGCLPRIAAARHDLHGDRMFCQGEVEVIEPAHSLLPVLDSCGIEKLREPLFVRTNMQPVVAAGHSTGDLHGVAIDLPAPRGMGRRLPAHFKFLPVQSIHYVDWHGKAFDATTSRGIYNYAGFVVSNCRCVIVPYIEWNANPADADTGE